MPTYEYYCAECDEIRDWECPMADRPPRIVCYQCAEIAEYRISAPGLVLREAYVDGTRRKGWSEMREASALNKQIGLQSDAGEKRRIEKQIRDLGVQVRRGEST